MKKFYSMLAVLLGFSICVMAEPQQLLNEDFESGKEVGKPGADTTYVSPILPDGWEVYGDYAGADFSYSWHNYYVSKGYVINGKHAATCDAQMAIDKDDETAAGPKEELLVTPQLKLDGTYRLVFYWKAPSLSPLENGEFDFQVRVFEDGANNEAGARNEGNSVWSFLNEEQLRESGVTVFPWTGWQPYQSEIDLSAWQGKTVRVAFVHKMLKKVANMVQIDDVVVESFTPVTTPQAELNTEAYTFGAVFTGSKNYSNIITLKNTGKDGLKVTGVDFSGNADYSTTIDMENLNLKKNETYDFQIIYQPTLTNSPNVTMTLKTNGGDAKVMLRATKKALPDGYTFEGFETSTPPVGWTASGWKQTDSALEGDYSAFSTIELSTASNDLISPRLDLSSGAHTVYFTYNNFFETEGETGTTPDSEIHLYLSTDGGNSWTKKWTGSKLNTTEMAEVNLGSPKSDNCRLKWSYVNPEVSGSDSNPLFSNFFLDGVTVPPIYGRNDKPGAAVLTAPADGAENVYNKEVVLSWQPVLFAESYDLHVGTTSGGSDVLKQEGLTATTYTLPRCEYNKTYYWKVIPRNAKGAADNVPVWSFTTMADQSVSDFPWSETFEDGTFPPLGWRMEKDGYTAWSNNSINPFDGKYSVNTNASSKNNTTTILETPEFKLPADETCQISFYWGNYVPVDLKTDPTGMIKNTTTEPDGIDACFFEVSDGNEWTVLKIMSDKNNPYWVRDRISLEAYKGKTVTFRWRYTAYQVMKATSVALDNIVVETATAEKATFNAARWDLGEVNHNATRSSGEVFTLLNDGVNELTIKSVNFTQSGFSSTLAAGDKIAAGEGRAFSLTFRAANNNTSIEDKMTVEFESGYKVEFPVKVVVLPDDVFYSDFEDDAYGSLQPHNYTTIDVDHRSSFNFALLMFEHYGEPFAYMVMNGIKADWNYGTAHSGQQTLVALAANDEKTDVEDWIVGPGMTATDQSQFRFFARNYESASPGIGQAFKASNISVLVSTTSNTDRDSFEEVMSETLPYFDGEYSEYTVDLSAYAGKTIYVALRHTVNDGMAAFFDDFYFEHFSAFDAKPNGVDMTHAADGITVYPNPVADIAYLSGTDHADVTVYSLSGLVMQQASDVNRIDLSNLEAGTYILQVKCAEGNFQTRIIKR